MNPLIKKSIENLSQRGNFTEVQLHQVLVEMGNLAMNVAAGVKQNPDANLKGGDSIDENTLGNFDFEYLQLPG